ncbi:TerB family tellurite resistance protein [Streptomyces sp. NPDC046860]|uniref:TerB family tellurite resistance protein n=1 Tax=Streptomyces sp. NPDC046860 TaxID=3154495 RepID=UPI0033CD8BF3
MLPVRGRDGRADGFVRRILGTRTAWTPQGDGEFFCPGCGGDRNYQRLAGRRRLTLLGVPVLARGAAEPVVECASCLHRFGLDTLDPPTTRRLSVLLREAVQEAAVSVLAAGGTGSRAAQETAAATLRAAGCEADAAERLAMTADAADPRGPLTALTPHLATAGRETVLLDAALIALADGPYTPAEHTALTEIGESLLLPAEAVERVLTTARTPS